MKEQILQTALEQFLKYGIRQMSIRKLVSPLGISTKTVYKYFKNKEQLLEACLQLFFAQQYELLEDISAQQHAVVLVFEIWRKGIEMEYHVNKAFFQDLHILYPELEKKIESLNAKKFWKKFIGVIQMGIEEGDFNKRLHPEATLEGVTVLYLSIVRTEKFKKLGISSNEILLNTIAPFVRGICTEKGTRILNEHIDILQLSKKSKSPKIKITHN